MTSELNLKRFMALFRGNDRSYGQWDPNKPKGSDKDSWTEHGAPTAEAFKKHLDGVRGIGVVPVRDDGLCFWGAIDIDNHGLKYKGPAGDQDFATIEAKVAEMQLPLIVTRSKSGGAHLYLFGSEPLSANAVRALLTRWQKEMEIDGSDCIYPRQSKVDPNATGIAKWGNWINLPYYDAAASPRRAIVNGKQISLDQFLTEAENKAVTKAHIDKLFASEHSEAPPCLQALFTKGIDAGERNASAYQVAVYCRKKDPNTAYAMAIDVMNRSTSTPMSYSELSKTVKSATRSSCRYKCQEEPFKSLCDRVACKKLKYGISDTEANDLAQRDAMPQFSDLVKYTNTDPVQWEFKVNEVPVRMQTEFLMKFKKVKEQVMEKLNIILPTIKDHEWEEKLRELTAGVRFAEVPADSTMTGVLKTRLDEFVRKADLTSDGMSTKDREAMQRGVPVVQVLDGQRVVMFRSVDFVNYLKATKTDGIPQKDLWFKASRELGVQHSRVRVGNNSFANIWYTPVTDELSESQSVPEFKSEI